VGNVVYKESHTTQENMQRIITTYASITSDSTLVFYSIKKLH